MHYRLQHECGKSGKDGYRTLYIGISGGLSERDSIALNRELSPGSTE